MKLSDLATAPYNPREITDEALSGLKASLGDFGDLSGITWNRRTGHLVCGHQRLRALQEEHGDELRMVRGSIHTPTGEQFKVREVDWSEEKERAANITANSPLISGAFTGELEDILASLEQDYSEMFAPLRLDEMLGELQPPVPLEDDEVPEPPKDPVTRAGDVWVLGDHRLLCGDCKHGEDIARILNGENARLVIADPEYDDRDMSWLGFSELAKIDHWLVMASDRQHAAALKQDSGLFNQFLVVYFKQFSWNLNVYIPLLQHVCIAHYKANGAVNHHLNGLHSVIECSSKFDKSVSHPHAKHVELLALLLQGFSASNDCALDLFSGSGTTIIAAEQLNRRCFGIEIDPGYCDVIVERWENLTGGKATR